MVDMDLLLIRLQGLTSIAGASIPDEPSTMQLNRNKNCFDAVYTTPGSTTDPHVTIISHANLGPMTLVATNGMLNIRLPLPFLAPPLCPHRLGNAKTADHDMATS
jgi:hypothetical protein